MTLEDSPLRDRVVFVTGSPRSGTTWVAHVLGGHPAIAAAPAESHLFDRGVGTLFDNHESTGEWSRFLAEFLDRVELVDLVRDLCDGILLRMRDRVRPGATHVLEKTPAGSLYPSVEMARKLECFPDGWYVHVIRDPRAVAASLTAVPWGPASLSGGADVWRRSVVDIREVFGRHPRYREVRYEDLLGEPEAGFKQMLTWLGLAMEQGVRERLARVREMRLAPAGEGPLAPHRWREQLAAADVARIEAIAGDLLEALGYSPAAASGASVTPARAADPRVAVKALAEALRDRSGPALEAVTEPDVQVRLRTGAGDADLAGDEGREALVALGRSVFEEWTPRSVWLMHVEGEWGSIWFSGERADRRADLAVLAHVRDGLVDSVAALVPGDPAGRPTTR